MAYKLLLTDAHSPLGTALSHVLEQETFTLVRPQPGEIDWRDADTVTAYLRDQQPNIVINSLAWVEVPARQRHALIAGAAKSLARACAALDICAIHLSSYRVFGGENKTAYDESDQPAPVDATGRALWRAEKAFSGALQRHIILRLSWLIGIQGDNLLTLLVDRLAAGQEVVVDPCKRGTPTLMADVGRVLVAMVRQMLCGADNWGVMHYTSGDPCSEAEFARHLAKLLQQQDRLSGSITELAAGDTAGVDTRAIADDDSEQPVPSAVLNGRRCRENFGIQPHTWRQGLSAVIDMHLATREAVSAGG